MHPIFTPAWSRLEQGRLAAVERVARRSAEERAYRATALTWSLDDIVEHLVLVERGIASAIAKDPTPDRPRIVKPGRWWRWPLMRLVLRAGVRIKAPSESILPTRTTSFEVLVEEWAADQGRLRAWLESVPETLLAAPRFRHPLAGWLTIPQAVTFAGDHLGHHLSQVHRSEQALTKRS